MIYVDASFLVSIYCPDVNAPAARRTIQGAVGEIWISTFADLEFVNALELRVFRKEDSSAESRGALAAYDLDMRNGVFQLKRLPEHVFLRVRQLSAQTTATLGTRAADLLHVATALEWGVDEFYTFDRQQAKLAQTMKLTTNFLP